MNVFLSDRNRWLWLAICILWLAAALRFHHLGHASLWYDEGNSWVQATRDLATIASRTARDIHPPGYYWLLAGAQSLLGESEFALRLPSAWASILAAACLIASGRRLGSWRTGVFAGALFAFNSFALDYAQQARMYALHTLWGMALVLMTLAWWQRPTRWRLVILALLNAAGLWTQYSFAFVILTQGIWFLLMSGSAWRNWLYQWLSLYTLTGLFYLPWLAPAYRSVSGWPNTGEAWGVVTSLRELLRSFSVGSAGEYSPIFAVAVAAATVLILVPWALNWRRIRAAERAAPLWTLVPTLLFLWLGLSRSANLKFLLPAQAVFALWLGWGLARWWRWRPWSAILVATPLFAGLVFGANDHFEQGQFRRADYRAAVTHIQREILSQPDIPAALILNGPGQKEVFFYYDARLTPPLSTLIPVYPLPVAENAEQETRRILMEYQRIYVLFWGETERDPQQVVERVLTGEGHLVDANWYGDLRLSRYGAPAVSSDFTPLTASFHHPSSGETLGFLGFSLAAQENWQPGDWLPLTLQWQVSEEIHTRYRIFVQLLYPEGQLAVTQDSEPGGNLQPTTNWRLGATITDRHALPLPLDLPPGEYRLSIGVYPLWQPNERLHTDGGNTLGLATIWIHEE